MKQNICLYIFFVMFITGMIQGIIEPDLYKPLIITPLFNKPVGDIGTLFEFRFLLADRFGHTHNATPKGKGGVFGQYIGVRFEDYAILNPISGMLENIDFKFQTIPMKYKCTLLNIDTGFYINVRASFPEKHVLYGNIIEKNVVYCKIIELLANKAILPGNKYKLTIEIINVIPMPKSLGGFTLFVSTDNTPAKTILDYGEVPNVLIPQVYNAAYSNIIISLFNGASSINIELNQIKPIELQIQFNTWFSWKDHIICIKYPINNLEFDSDTKLNVSNIPGSTISIPIKPLNAIIIESNDPKYTILGFAIDEIFHSYSAYTYKMNIDGLKSVKIFDNTETIEVFIRLRNTLDMIAYLAFPCTTKTSLITLTTKHIDTTNDLIHDVFSGGGWPINFTIKVDSDIYVKYLLIKQINANPKSRVTFIASTCDFSNFPLITPGFASMPRCYPIDYSNNPDENNSSGVFFYLNQVLEASKEYSITIWIFFDECGESHTDNLFDDTDYKADILFGLFIYEKIDKNAYASSRINPTYLQRDNIKSNPITCYNTYMGKPQANSDLYDMTDYTSSTLETATITAGTIERLMYKEYFDWDIFDFDGKYQNNPLMTDLSETTSISPKYIYSKISGNKITERDHILLRAKSSLESSSRQQLGQFFPIGLTVNSLKKYVAIKGRFFTQISPQWVKKTENPICFAGWGFGAKSISNTIDWLPKSTAYPQKYHWVTNSEDFHDDTTTIYNPQIDTINNNHLMTFSNEGWDYTTANGYTKAEWGFGNDDLITQRIGENVPEEVLFGFADSCHQWNNLDQTIKSTYTPIEILLGIKWEGNANFASRYIRLMRLIKLFPEGGVFNERTTANLASSSGQIITNHYAYMNEASKGGVCLFEIMPGIINNKFNSNTFFLWMFMGSLLESDYDIISSNYPIGNLRSNAKAYGFTSQHSLNPNNYYAQPSPITNSDISSPILRIANVYTSQTKHGLTSYLFYLGSAITLHLESPGNYYDVTNNLLIPYYCPFYHSNASQKPYSLGIFPSFIGSFMNINSLIDYGNKGVEGFLGQKTYNNNHAFILLSNRKALQNNPPNQLQPIFNTLQFSPITTPTMTLSIWNAMTDIPNVEENDNCSGFVWLFSDSVVFSLADPEKDVPSLKYFGNVRKHLFYAFGKKYSQAIFASNAVDIPITATIPGQTPYLTINTKFRFEEHKNICDVSIGKFCPYDNVAYWCTSKNFDMINYHTNHVQSLNKSFLNYSKSPLITIPTIALNEDLYNLKEHALSIKIVFPSPIPNPPIQSEISLRIINHINAMCVIGSNVLGQSSSACLTDSTGLITCEITESFPSYDIYCYKIDMDLLTDLNVEVTDFLFKFPNSNTDWDKYVNGIVFTSNQVIKTKVIPVTSNTGNIQITPFLSKLSTINQGIGKIYLKIPLGRPVHPNMVITINSNLSLIALQNIKTICKLSFTLPNSIIELLEEGEYDIDGCIVDLSLSIKTIQAYFKPTRYNPQKMMKDVVYIALYPVRLENIISLTYTIDVTCNTIPIINSVSVMNYASIVPALTPSTPRPVVFKDSLGKLISVSSQIYGDKSDYVIEFDFSSTVVITNLGATQITEITLYLQQMSFDSSINNPICYDTGNRINCSFEEELILNIVFPSPIPIRTNKKIVITGFTNTYSTSTSFLAVTYNTFILGIRKNIIVGSVEIVPSFFSPTPSGPLKFYSVPLPTSSALLRDTSIHTFRVGFDYSNGQIITTTTFPIGSKFIIEFPSDYFMILNRAPLISIKEYYSDDSLLPTDTNNVVIQSINLYHNRIVIDIGSITPSVTTNFKFWEIEVDNIVNPMSVSSNGSTNTFIITCIANNNAYFTTSINRITYATHQLFNDNNYHWNIGNIFTFDNMNKYGLDVESIYKVKNQFTLQPGRYHKLFFTTRSNKQIDQSYTDVQFNDPLFNTERPSYLISTLYGEPYPFYFGTSCTTTEGVYLIKPIFSNIDDFIPAPTIMITLRLVDKAIITVDSSYIIPFNNQVWIPLYFSEPNYDQLSIDWKKDSTVDINTSMIPIQADKMSFSDKSIGYNKVFSTCQIKDSTNSIITLQQFSPISPNKCYQFSIDQIGIQQTNSLIIPPIPITLHLTTILQVYHYGLDPTLEANELKIIITPPVKPVFVTCSLVCKEQDYTKNSDLKFDDYTEVLTKGYNYNPLKSYYYGYMDGTKTTLPMHFKGLIKGFEYKISCLIKTNALDNTSVQISYGITEIGDIPFKTYQTYDTQCISYTFTKELSLNEKQRYIDYCQGIFNINGYESNGCIKCSDSSGLIQPTGFINNDSYFSCQKESCSTIQESIDISTLINNNYPSTELTICATSSRICHTNPKIGKDITTLFPQFIDETKDDNLIRDNLKLSNVYLDNSRQPIKYLEKSINESTIIITLLTLAPKPNDKIQFQGQSTDGIMNCFWQIVNTKANEPFAESIMLCTSTLKNCGVATLTTKPTVFTVSNDKHQNLTPLTEYSVYMTCTRKVPSPKHYIKLSLGSFTVEAKSSYINLNYYYLLLLVIALVN